MGFAALLLLLCSLPAARPAAADGRAMQHMLAFFRQAVDAGVHKGQSYSAAGCPTHSLSCNTALATRSICEEPAPAPLLAGHGILPVPGLALAGGIAGDVDPALAKYIRVPMHARPAGRFTADLAQSAFTRVSDGGWCSKGVVVKWPEMCGQLQLPVGEAETAACWCYATPGT